ncbi:putative reverse transcriptase domain, viral movement protein [Tanacetum coccineum]
METEEPVSKNAITGIGLAYASSENAVAQNKVLVKILSQQGVITNSQEYLSSRVRSLESIINELHFKFQELHREIIQIIRTSPTTQHSSSISQKEAKMKNLKNQLQDLEQQHKQKRITSLIDDPWRLPSTPFVGVSFDPQPLPRSYTYTTSPSLNIWASDERRLKPSTRKEPTFSQESQSIDDVVTSTKTPNVLPIQKNQNPSFVAEENEEQQVNPNQEGLHRSSQNKKRSQALIQALNQVEPVDVSDLESLYYLDDEPSINLEDRIKSAFCIPDHHYQWKSHAELLSKFYSLVTKYEIMLSEKKMEVRVTTIQFLGMDISAGNTSPKQHVARITKILQTDASDECWGAVLLVQDNNNKRHVCRYKSGTFKASEQHYHSTFKEILAVKRGIKKFQFHLIGHEFQVEMDMYSFPYMLQFKRKMLPHAQLLRWSNWFSQWKFTVKHIKGTENVNLSSKRCERKLRTLYADIKSLMARANGVDPDKIPYYVMWNISVWSKDHPDAYKWIANGQWLYDNFDHCEVETSDDDDDDARSLWSSDDDEHFDPFEDDPTHPDARWSP